MEVALLKLRLGLGGRIEVETTGLVAQAFRAAGLEQPPGTLYSLPLAAIPTGRMAVTVFWALPDGRNQDDHHLFPVGTHPFALKIFLLIWSMAF